MKKGLYRWKYLTLTGSTSEDNAVGVCFSGESLPVGGRDELLTTGSEKVLGPILKRGYSHENGVFYNNSKQTLYKKRFMINYTNIS